jgi:hypothetical protein
VGGLDRFPFDIVSMRLDRTPAGTSVPPADFLHSRVRTRVRDEMFFTNLALPCKTYVPQPSSMHGRHQRVGLVG